MSIRRIGKFTVVGELGTGAHSTILHILRNEDHRHYALKVVPIDSADEKSSSLKPNTNSAWRRCSIIPI